MIRRCDSGRCALILLALTHLGLASLLASLAPVEVPATPLRTQPSTSHPASYEGASGEWSDMFSRPGIDDAVHAFTMFDSLLVLGGAFRRAGHENVYYVAGWDGSGWSPMGSSAWVPGQAEDPTHVYDLVVHDTTLVACGRLRGSVDDLIARWDGHAWVPLAYLADPVNNFAAALEIYDNDLIVSGFFGIYGYIARFDGAAWQPLGEGFNERALALTVYDEDLIAAGRFTLADDKPARRIARWDGQTWNALGDGFEGDVRALAVYEGHLIAGGDFPGYAAAWNETTWLSLDEADLIDAGGALPGPVHVLCAFTDPGDGDRLLVGGGSDTTGFVLSLRPGESPDSLSVGLNSRVEALMCVGGSVFAGGSFTRVDSLRAYNAAEFDGTTWKHLGADGYGLDIVADALEPHEGGLVVAATPGPVQSWNGTSWTTFAGHVNHEVHDMISHDGDLFIGGEFTEIDGRPTRYLARWDGEGWTEVGTGVNGTVLTLEVHGDTLVAGGDFSVAGGVTVRNIAAWDGMFWSAIGEGREHVVDDLAVWDGDLILLVRNSIQRWNGKDFQLIGSTFGVPRSLAANDSVLIVGGDFSEFDGVPANGVAVWDGEEWSALGAGVSGIDGVFDVAFYNGNPVAAGDLSSPCTNISRWDGFTWRCMGGLDSTVNRLVVWDGQLAAGGKFAKAGNLSSNRFALWDDHIDPLGVFRAESRDEAISLYWETPPDARFRGALIRFAGDHFPAEPADGQPLPNGNDGRFDGAPGEDSTFLHTGLPSDVRYYYTAFCYDESGRLSAPALAFNSTLDKLAPDTATNFVATSSTDFIHVRWTNPVNEDFKGTLVRFSMDGFPLTPTDGEPLPNGHNGHFDAPAGSNGAFVHSGLVVAKSYYYSAFTYDWDYNYSAAVGAHALIPDTDEPVLEVDVFQNPYLDQYLDVVLVGSEPLDSASVTIQIESDTLDAWPVKPGGTVWAAHGKIDGPGGLLSIGATAADTSGNTSGASKEFAAGYVLRHEGGEVAGPDGRINLSLEPNTLARDAYILVVGTGGNRGASEVASYRVSPPGALIDSCHATITFAYDSSDLESPGSPDRLYIETEAGPLPSYVDPAGRTVSARVGRLGTFRLVLGGAGSSEVIDPAYLKVELCRPNPFSDATTVRFAIRASQRVAAAIYNTEGRLVKRLADRVVGPGFEEIGWDGTAGSGRRVPSGVYFIVVETDHRQHTSKLLLVR